MQPVAELAAVAHAARRARCTSMPCRRPAGCRSSLADLGVDALSLAGPQARRPEGHRRARRARPHAARAAAARRRAGARTPSRHRERRRRRRRSRPRCASPRPSGRMPRRASPRCGDRVHRARARRRCPARVLTGDPRAPAARHGVVRASPARAARPCCSSSSARRRLLERIGVRGGQRRAVARAARARHRPGGRADRRAIHARHRDDRRRDRRDDRPGGGGCADGLEPLAVPARLTGGPS